jgi:WD40 repeat protein
MVKFQSHYQIRFLILIMFCISLSMQACQSQQNLPPASPTSQPTATILLVDTQTPTVIPTPTFTPLPTETPTQVPSPTPTPIPIFGSRVINETNASQMREIGRLGNGIPKDVAYSPDGQMFGVCSSTGLYLYVNTTWEGPNLLGEETACESMVWSPDSKFLVSGNVDGTIRVWNVETEEQVRIMGDGDAAVTSVAWASDGHTLASGDSSDSITLWNTENGEPTQLKDGYCSGCSSQVAWSPDSQYLAIAIGQDIEVWDINKDEIIRKYTTSKYSFNGITWSPDGNSLAAGSDGVQVWDIHTGEQVFSKELQSEYDWQIEELAWSPIGTYLATGDNYGNVEIWDTNDWMLINSIEGYGKGEITGIAWSPDGELITVSNSVGGIKHVRPTRYPASSADDFSSYGDFAWSPDGRTLASINRYDNTIETWDSSSGTKTHEFNDPMHLPSCVAWSPDGTKLATGSHGKIFIWDAESGEKVRTILVDESRSFTSSIAWSPDGTTIAIAGPYEGKVFFWNLSTDELIRVRSGYYYPVGNIAWHPEGHTLASSSGGIWLWNCETGKLVNNMAASNMPNDDIAWSPDGLFIALGGDENAAKIWNVKSGTATFQINGQSRWISSVAWHPSESILASGSREGATIYIWNSVTGELLHILNKQSENPNSPNSSTVYRLAFSPDGKTLASGSSDGTIRLWGLP